MYLFYPVTTFRTMHINSSLGRKVPTRNPIRTRANDGMNPESWTQNLGVQYEEKEKKRTISDGSI